MTTDSGAADLAGYSPKTCVTECLNYCSEAIWGQIQIMSGQHPPNGGTEIAAIPKGLRILAMFLRALVFGALVAITVRVSSPQSETIWTVYDTPRDLIMLALGFAVCLWIVIRFFRFPKTAEAYRTWVYFGLVLAPLAVATAIAIWLWA
jgi:hypothetical protein